MPAATDPTGLMQQINCIVTIPGVSNPLIPRILPEITDTKSVSYSDEPIIGRSFPLKTYGHSDNRTITMKWHVLIVDDTTMQEAIQQLQGFQSAVYPQTSNGISPYEPPPICTITCGNILATGSTPGLCVVLKSYSVSYPTDVAWDEDTLIPYKFDIDLVWDVVYATSELPGQSMIIP